MTDSTLADISAMLAAIGTSVLRLPESRPSQFGTEWTSAIGDLLRACDSLIHALTGRGEQESGADHLLAEARAYRRLLFLAIAEADPDQAVFWTEAYKESERVSEAQTAAGLHPRYFADQQAESDLRARWLGDDA